MAESVFEAMRGGAPKASGTDLLRLDPLSWRGELCDVSFSGGVSEYIYGGEIKSYGDLGLPLAGELRARLPIGLQLARPEARIRATVIGAAQYTVQVSGSTIFVSPLDTLPLRNVPVIAAALPLETDKIEPATMARVRSRCSCHGAARRHFSGSVTCAAAFSTVSIHFSLVDIRSY